MIFTMAFHHFSGDTWDNAFFSLMRCFRAAVGSNVSKKSRAKTATGPGFLNFFVRL